MLIAGYQTQLQNHPSKSAAKSVQIIESMGRGSLRPSIAISTVAAAFHQQSEAEKADRDCVGRGMAAVNVRTDQAGIADSSATSLTLRGISLHECSKRCSEKAQVCICMLRNRDRRHRWFSYIRFSTPQLFHIGISILSYLIKTSPNKC